MHWVFMVIGVGLGSAFAELWGAISGGLLGLFGGLHIHNRSRFKHLEDQLKELKDVNQNNGIRNESEFQRSAVMGAKTREQLNSVGEGPKDVSLAAAVKAQESDAGLSSELQSLTPLELEDSELNASEANSSEVNSSKSSVEDQIVLEQGAQDPSVQEHTTPKNQSDSFVKNTEVPARKHQFNAKDSKSGHGPSEVRPRKELPIDKLINLVKRYFTEGNVVVRIGLVVMFFGFSFLAKYSVDNALVPIELRLLAILLAGMAMLVFGWRFRLKNENYALLLQGGGVATLYLVIFTAYRLYDVLPATLSFGLLVIFSFLAMSLAVLQNSRVLAITAIAGGFASPILASSGGGSHVALFSYYLVLNLAIFSVAWFKSWRLLNLIGFGFTFVVGALWGVTEYSSQHFASTEPFLVIYFLLYVAISVLFAIKQEPKLRGYVDGSLVFGVPLIGFALQSSIVHRYEYGLAWSAFALAAFYIGLSRSLWRLQKDHMRVFCEALLILGVIFATLTLPFALDSRLSAASWAIEGAGFVWLGLKQGRAFVKYFGFALQGGAASLFVFELPYYGNGLLFINTEYLGVLIISVAALIIASLLEKFENQYFKKLRVDIVFIVMGLLWWYVGGLLQLEQFLSSDKELFGMILYVSVSSLIFGVSAIHVNWKSFSFFPWLFIVPLFVLLLMTLGQNYVFDNFGYIAWPVSLLIGGFLLHRSDRYNYVLIKKNIVHCASYCLLVFVLALEFSTHLDFVGLSDAWQATAFILPLVSAIAFATVWKYWPVKTNAIAYQKYSVYVFSGVFLLWVLSANIFNHLSAAPLVYLPILNPIDIAQALGLLVVGYWLIKILGKEFIVENLTAHLTIVVATGFLWFNAMMFKTIHVYLGVAYQPEALFDSSIVQMAVSISWSILGLAAMVVASRLNRRKLWMVGASLAGLVVVKLFLIDLSERETVERIISFLVVGTLLLVVGYFSPMPAKEQSIEIEGSDNV